MEPGQWWYFAPADGLSVRRGRYLAGSPHLLWRYHRRLARGDHLREERSPRPSDLHHHDGIDDAALHTGAQPGLPQLDDHQGISSVAPGRLLPGQRDERAAGAEHRVCRGAERYRLAISVRDVPQQTLRYLQRGRDRTDDAGLA